MDLQGSIFADETDPPIFPAIPHPCLNLSQCLPEFLETGLRLVLNPHEILLPDRALCDRKERSAAFDGEMMVGRLRKVDLGTRTVLQRGAG